MANKMMKFLAPLLAVCAIMTAAGPASAQDKTPMKLVQNIPLPNVSGRLDHLAIDLKRDRLFVAALGNNTVEVIDLKHGKSERSLEGFAKPQGLFFAPNLDKLFVSSGDDGTCKIFGGGSLQVGATVKLALGADLMDYDPAAKQIFVGHGGKDAGQDHAQVAVIDGGSGKLISDIETESHPGSILLETSGPRVFVTIPDKNEIVVIDRKNRAVIAKWPAPGTERTASLALDEKSHRLFVGSRTPPKVIVLDANDGKAVTSFPTVGVMDGLFYDASRKRLYATGGEGFLYVHQQKDADSYLTVARIPTAPTARTSLFVPELRRLYLGVPRSEKQETAEIRVYEVVP